MRSLGIGFVVLSLAACSGDDTANPVGLKDASTNDATSDTGAPDTSIASDSAPPTDASTGADANDGAPPACPSAWTVAPAVDPSLDVPDGGGGVLLHASASGTQNYTCQAVTVDGGTAYSWVFVGPEAALSDCNAALIGHHFATDAGAAAPEWQTTDGAYVVGKKVAASTPDGGAGSVPWLLLQATSTGGSGALSKTAYVQRVRTDGGVAPTTACDATNMGSTEKVSYTADYYFFGTP